MTYVKAAIGTTLLLICLLVGYMFVAFDTQYELDVAYESFLRGQYQEAYDELAKLDESLPEDQRQLYQAYAMRGLRNFDDSSALLEQAVFQAQQRRQQDLVLEGLLNQALNAYLTRDVEQLRVVISQAQEAWPNQPWVTFFQAIERYLSEDYAQALELWSLPYHRLPLSGWMKKSFENVFTRLWLVLRLTRCQIEEGKYLLARQTLEEEVDSVTESELHEVYFLLGLSYAKEAQDKPITAAAPYFKLANSYFNRVPMQSERYAAERRRLLNLIDHTAHGLIDTGSVSDLPFYASVMQSWGATEELSRVTQTLGAVLEEQIQAQNWARVKELTNILNRLILEESDREVLQKRFYSLASTALEEGNTDLVKEYWPAAYLFSDSSPTLAARFSKGLVDRIHSLLPADDATLKLSAPYIALWKDAEKDHDARVQLANELIATGESMWLQPDQEDKAVAIMQLALTLPFDQERVDVRNGLEKALTRVYNETIKRDDIDKLPHVFAAMERFDLGTIDLKQSTESKKHLGSAQELLTAGNFDEALRRALWVLQLEAENQEARSLTGQIYYRLAKYSKALEYLTVIEKPNLSILEMIAVSQILTKQEAAGKQLLLELQGHHPLNDDSYLRLGLGLLAQDQVKEGQRWLTQIGHPTAESNIGLAYAAYMLGDYPRVSKLIELTPPPYNALDGVRGLVIENDLATGQVELAEKALIKLLNQPTQPDTNGMSPPFRTFEQQKLTLFGRYFIAGLFFKDTKKKNDVATKYFNLIKDPTPEIRVVRGDTRLQLGDYTGAVEDLLAAATQSNDLTAQKRAMPLLARAYDGARQPIQALTWYRRFFELEKNGAEFRGAYAQTLLELRRYDLALEEYRLIVDTEAMAPRDAFGYVDALIHTNRFDEAVVEGKEFLNQQPPLPLDVQLRIARLMVVANAQELTWPMLQRLPPIPNLSSDETIHLLRFLMQIGSYGQALSVANAREEDLSKNIEGLLVQAELQYKLSRFTDALSLVQKAKSLNPADPSVGDALSLYARDINILETLANEAERAVDKEPSNLSPKVVYGERMAALGAWARTTEDQGHARFQSDIQKSLFHLGKVVDHHDDLPIVHNLRGQLLTLLNKPQEALEAYREAIKADPSYTDAFNNLAHLYRRLKDNRSAIRALYQAAKYSPSDALAWQKLAELYHDSGNLYEASNYYQNAIKYRPSNIRNYIALGRVFLELRNPEDAQMILEHGVELSPNNLGVLTVLLECLHDPLLHVSTNDREALTTQRDAIYNKIAAIDSKLAESTLKEIKENRPQWDFDFPPIDATTVWPEHPSVEGL